MITRSPWSLDYPRQPIHAFLRDAAARHGERVALRFDDESFSFRELDDLGAAIADGFLHRGIGVGDRVLLATANRPEWITVLHGLSQVGAAAVLGNSSWREVELRHALSLTGCRAVVADRPVIDQLIGTSVELPELRVSLDDGAPEGWVPLSQVVDDAATSAATVPELDADLSRLEAVLPFSSGTTGLPKAVRHTHQSLTNAVVQRVAMFGLSDTDRLQLFLPLFTAFGPLVTLAAFASGASVRLFRRFDAQAVLQNMEDEGITMTFGSAGVALALRDQPNLEDFDLSSLRHMIWGATPVSIDVAEEVTRRAGIRWLVAYACTETGIANNPVHEPERWRLDSPGLPLPDTELRVRDLESGADVPDGAQGEIVVRGPATMLGYLPEAADADAFVDDGWLRTGDIGWIEPEGWVHVTDRAKEMIKVSGFQVAPAELEQLLLTNPEVADCAVYGIPDARTGEAPKAAVVRALGSDLTADEVTAYVAERLARYKHLRAVVFVDAIPRNSGGKVLRRVLRDADDQRG